MKHVIYRGFDIDGTPDGKFIVGKPGEQISDKLPTEEEAYRFVDRYIRMGGK